MFEAYSVAVRVQLRGVSTFTAGLMRISQAFANAHGGAERLEAKLAKIRAFTAGGLAVGGAGALGLALLTKSLKPASEYAHQLNIINMAGVKQADIAQMVGAAWKNSGDVMTTTATQNLRAMLDLRNVLGSVSEAKWALPTVTKIGAVMAASSEGSVRANAENIAFDMAKALDIIGAARDPGTFAHQASMMSKVVTAFQNRVTPRQFQSVFAYARQAKYDLSDEFKYEILPSLMLEMSSGAASQGGGSRGVGPMLAALYRVTNQGYVNKKALPLLQRLGWVTPHTALRTTTSGTTVGPMIEAGLAASNPFLWAQHRVADVRRLYGANASDSQVRQVINQAFRGNQLAAALMTEFATKPKNFIRDQALIRGAMPYDKAYAAAVKDDPATIKRALGAQWHNVRTQLGTAALPLVLTGTKALTTALTWLGGEMKRHPLIVKALVGAFAGLSVLAVIAGGALLATAAITAMGAVIGTVGATVAIATGLIVGLGVGIAGLIKYAPEAWRELKAFGRWIGHEFAAGWRAAQNVAQATWQAITTAMGTTWAGVKGLVANLGSTITGWLSSLLGWVRHQLIPGFMDGPQSQGQSHAGGKIPSAFHGSGRSPVVAPLHMNATLVFNHTTNLDGERVTNTVVKRINRAIGPGAHVGRHDPNATLPPAALGYA